MVAFNGAILSPDEKEPSTFAISPLIKEAFKFVRHQSTREVFELAVTYRVQSIAVMEQLRQVSLL
jgi:hypothetical protein